MYADKRLGAWISLRCEDLWDGQRLDAESLLALRCISEDPNSSRRFDLVGVF